ncbi:hypothetical protein [Mycobacterium colombiense]|nr:hypothetical protein [Mycobacterium colombiense]
MNTVRPATRIRSRCHDEPGFRSGWAPTRRGSFVRLAAIRGATRHLRMG